MRRATLAGCLFAVLLATVAFAQWGRRGYYEEDVPVPADASEKTEYVFARLRYDGYRRRRGGSWATDYPKADRQFLQGVRRLTRIHSRSKEQVVDVNSDEIFDYPWIYAVEVGSWVLSDEQGAHLREYINRGGFLMVDDFHGDYEWDSFHESFIKIFPDRPIVDLEDSDAVFHVLYDLEKRFQIPGVQYVRSGVTWEKGGVDPHWRGVYDEKGRLVVAICHNMDLGDAWEWADIPEYPEPFASLAYRVALNYIIYSMSH